MVTEELISVIKSKFQEGVHSEDIKYSLQQEGWDSADIDAAINQIRRDALKQLPVLRSFYNFLERMEAKTAHSSPKMTFTILGVCFAIVLVLFWGLYMVLDPLGTKGGQRDTQRETDVIKLRNGLNKYFSAHYAYPASLTDLSPEFIQTLPQDPKTGEEYTYKLLEGTSNYTLCVNFESRAPQCVSATPGASSIPVVSDPSQNGGVPDVSQSPADQGGTPQPSVIVTPTVGAAIPPSASPKAL